MWAIFSETFSYRGLYDARLSARCVKDMIVNGQWSWPEEWGSLYPNIVYITVPQLDVNSEDKVKWRTNNARKLGNI